MLSYILCQMLAVKIWGFRPILRGSVGFLFGWWLLESDLCSDLCQFPFVYRIFDKSVGVFHWDHMVTTNPQELTWKLKMKIGWR